MRSMFWWHADTFYAIMRRIFLSDGTFSLHLIIGTLRKQRKLFELIRIKLLSLKWEVKILCGRKQRRVLHGNRLPCSCWFMRNIHLEGERGISLHIFAQEKRNFIACSLHKEPIWFTHKHIQHVHTEWSFPFRLSSLAVSPSSSSQRKPAELSVIETGGKKSPIAYSALLSFLFVKRRESIAPHDETDLGKRGGLRVPRNDWVPGPHVDRSVCLDTHVTCLSSKEC